MGGYVMGEERETGEITEFWEKVKREAAMGFLVFRESKKKRRKRFLDAVQDIGAFDLVEISLWLWSVLTHSRIKGITWRLVID